jgi:hypothetical protein
VRGELRGLRCTECTAGMSRERGWIGKSEGEWWR